MFSWMGLLEASAAGGICIVLLSLVSQLFGERYRAKYRKALWILIAARMCIPVSMSFFPQPVTVEVPVLVLGESRGAEQADQTDRADRANQTDRTDQANQTYRTDQASQADSAEQTRLTFQSILTVLWACGSAVIMVYYILVHFMFCRRMRKKSRECVDQGILAVAAGIAGEMGLKNVPRIRLTEGVQAGPFTTGIFRSTVFLPEAGYRERDLAYILRHELAHCAGRDTRLKALFLTVSAVHWFNPLVWLMKSMADQDMELACDERVLAHTSGDERSEYSEVLMSCIGTDKAGRSALSTGYVQGVRFIKKRFRNIFSSQKKSGKVPACILAVLLAAASGLVGFQAGRTVYAGSGISIDCGIELRTDVTGDGVPDQIQVYDDTYMLTTYVGMRTAERREAHFLYNDEMWASSYMVSGDLDGNGAADIVVMRISNGMHGEGSPGILYLARESGVYVWREYPEVFIKNAEIGGEQPNTFDDIACVGATVIERDGRHCLRLVAIDMEAFGATGEEDTVLCIDCSWRQDGWYIEELRRVTGYYSENKSEELLENNRF